MSAALFRDLLEVITEATRGALRLRTEGRSTAPGAPPSWLVRAADFDVLGFHQGSTVIELEEPTLAETAGDRFAQEDLFHPIDPAQGALSLLQASLRDALEGGEDSELYDEPLLDRLEAFGRILSHGIERVEFTDAAYGTQLSVDMDRLGNVRRLRQETPPDQRVRVAGWLDAIRHSDRMFTLKLESGDTLRGVAVDVPPEHLASLFGRKATVSGTAAFRPSGKVLRIEANRIESAGDDFSFWSAEPEPLLRELNHAALRVSQGSRSGLNAVVGQWPGDENDDELIRILHDLS